MVAVFLRRRWKRSMGLPVLHLVLLYGTPHPGLHLESALLQLQPLGVYGVWASDRDGGVLDGICICAADIRVSRSNISHVPMIAD